MNSDFFRDSTLGFWSSHPKWKKRRRVWGIILSTIPITLLILCAIYHVFLPGSWSDILNRISGWLTPLSVALSISLAASLTLTICARIGCSTLSSELKQSGNNGTFPFDPWIFFLGLLLGASAPALITRIPGITPSLKMTIRLFALLPLFSLLFALSVFNPEPKKKKKRQQTRSMGLFLLFLFVFTLWCLTLWHDVLVAGGEEGLKGFLPWYPDRSVSFLGTLILLPLTYFLFICWRKFTFSFRESWKKTAGSQPAKKSIWSRILNWFSALLSRPEESKPIIVAPRWVEDLLQIIGENTAVTEQLSLQPHEVSPTSNRKELRHIFGIESPTSDQVQVLERFRELYKERVVGRHLSETPTVEECPDILLLGNPGSGRTTTLLACAVEAAFVRGQRVLMIVPDSLRQELMQERVKRFLKEIRLDHYMSVGLVDRKNISKWINNTKPIPQIMIGTVDAVEQELYGHHVLSQKSNQLRQIVLLPEVILVDDFLDFLDSERSHLPFLLDKHRLLLASEYLSLQVIISCQTLSVLGERVLGKRLFSEKYFDQHNNVLHIKPCHQPEVWRVYLEVDNLTETTDRLMKESLNKGLSVVLYQSDIDKEEQNRLQSFWDKQQASGQVEVVTSLDRPLTKLSKSSVDVIFCHAPIQQDICFSLCQQSGNQNTVVFCVLPKGASQEPIAGTIPIVAAASAVPWQVTHLQSVCRFLRPNSPIPTEYWNRFGIDFHKVPESLGREFSRQATLFIDHWNQEEYHSNLWHFISLSHFEESQQFVSSHSLPSSDLDLIQNPQQHQLVIGKWNTQDNELNTRRARWQGSRGNNFGEIGEIDLAHSYQFKLIWKQRSFGVQSMRKQADEPVVLTSENWRGNGEDRYLPIFNISWNIPAESNIGKYWGGKQDGLRWFELTSTQSAINLDAEMTGCMSDLARVTEITPIPFNYPIHCFGLVLNPKEIDNNILDQAITKNLEGNWATQNDKKYFCPALTGAFNYSLRKHMPGIYFFGRMLAFHLPKSKSEIGSVIVWFIEPTSGGRSASRVFGELLRDREERNNFLQTTEWFLNKLKSIPDKDQQNFTRQMSRLGFGDDKSAPHINRALKIIESLVPAE